MTEPDDTVQVPRALLEQLVQSTEHERGPAFDQLRATLAPALPPRQRYLLLCEVTWQPTGPQDEGPLDMAHNLTIADDRVTDWRMLDLGSPDVMQQAIFEFQEADAQERQEAAGGAEAFRPRIGSRVAVDHGARGETFSDGWVAGYDGRLMLVTPEDLAATRQERPQVLRGDLVVADPDTDRIHVLAGPVQQRWVGVTRDSDSSMQQIEWLLRAISSEYADPSQRTDDLQQLAKLIQAHVAPS